MEPKVDTAILERAQKIAPVLREHAAEGERNRRLAKPALDALRSAGLLGLYLPKSLGGLETDPVTSARVFEEVALAHSAAGWALQANTSCFAGAALPAETAEEIWKAPDTFVASAFFPPIQATPTQGGFKLNGRRPFASGIHDASWHMFTAMVMEHGQPKMVEGHPVILAAWHPTRDAVVHDTWDALGMRATDTNDIEARDMFVPQARTFPFVPDAKPNKHYTGPLYKMPLIATAVVTVMPPVALAVARNAIQEVVALAQNKHPFPATSALKDKGAMQGRLGEAEAMVRAGRALLYQELAATWELVKAGKTLTLQQKNDVYLAGVHALNCAVRATDIAHRIGGMHGVFAKNPLEHHFRDAMTLRHHGLVCESRYETAGQVLLGLPPDVPFVAF